MRFIPNLDYDMDDSDVSTDDSYGSDLVDSDIEAELYSTVHHETASTEPDKNPNIEQNSSINLISVEENSTVIEKVLDSNSNPHNNIAKKSSQNQVIENTDVSLKRKSNLVTNILGSIQVKKDSPRKKQKTANRLNRVIDLVSSPGSSTIEIIDSDSDSSVILSEPEESSVGKLQTNIANTETVNVSSDSESTCDSLKDSRFSFHSNINDNTNSKESYKDVWQIDSVDLYRSKRKYSGRYHENAVSQCNNCNKKGHAAKFCTEPRVYKCIICGGAHMHMYCKNRICTRCLRFGHDRSRCYHPAPDLLCSICNMRGHSKKCCPDLWRRFHLTTSDGNIVKGKLLNHSRPIYCFNCGSEGHYGYDCREARMGWSYPNWSSVISYEHPSVSQNQFCMNSNFGGPIPQLQHQFPALLQHQFSAQLQHQIPAQLQNQIPAQLQHQIPAQLQRRGAAHLSRLETRRLLRMQKLQEKKRLNVSNKELKRIRKQKAREKQEARANTVFLNENLKQGTSHINREINFPRTPKPNTNSPECQCVDEMPKIKRKRRGGKKGKKKEKKLLRKQMQVLQNCS